jgi:hypothetical protein
MKKPLVWILEILIGIVVIAGLPLFYIGAGLHWCRGRLLGQEELPLTGYTAESLANKADRWLR